MTYLYIIFSVIALLAECSKNINTRNLFKKFGLALIIIGCLVKLSGHENELILIGSFSYILSDLWEKMYGK